MENNLTLPILCSYYPYGVNIVVSHRNQPDRVTKLMLSYLHCTDGVKLLLRPMSDLTKEIEHNGERFVPIIELAKMAKFGSNQNNEQPYKECGKPPYGYEADQFRPYYHCWHQFRRGGSYQIIYDNFGLYVKEQQQGWYANYAVNIFEMNQKLLEWHFDIYGLLESGNALNLNEYNGN